MGDTEKELCWDDAYDLLCRLHREHKLNATALAGFIADHFSEDALQEFQEGLARALSSECDYDDGPDEAESE